MSDIIQYHPGAAERAMEWIEGHIEKRGLGVGDLLPTELQIAAAAGVSRSSVREAMRALRVLGIVRSRRKGGCRIVREAVLLNLRKFFDADLAATGRYGDAMEFRGAMEWGLGPLMFQRAEAGTVRKLRAVVEQARATDCLVELNRLETAFHVTLVASCGNRLGLLFAHLYSPLFQSRPQNLRTTLTPTEKRRWLRQHADLVSALAARNEGLFLRRLRQHTQ